MAFDFSYDDKGITLTVHQEAPGYLKGLFARPNRLKLGDLSAKDRNLLFAIADLKQAAERCPSSGFFGLRGPFCNGVSGSVSV